MDNLKNDSLIQVIVAFLMCKHLLATLAIKWWIDDIAKNVFLSPLCNEVTFYLRIWAKYGGTVHCTVYVRVYT